MNLRFVASCGLVCAALVFTGCDEGRKAPGRTTVQVANVASGFPSLNFQREHNPLERPDELVFRDTRVYLYDADTYDFYVEEPTYDNEDPGRVWTFAPTLEASTHYTFVLTEVAGEVVPVVIPNPAPPTAADAAQILGLHAAARLPAMDLYLERPGVGIAGATPRGTFNPNGQIAPLSLPSGDYELFLTAAGNPASVLLFSQQFNLPAGTTSPLVVVDENGTGTAQISALLLGDVPQVLFDRNAPAEMRALNGAADQVPRDVAINSQFSPPLFSATAFGVPTPYAQIPLGTVPLNVTPVGNPGVLEVDSLVAGVIGQRLTVLFAGQTGALSPAFAIEDGRRYNREAKVRFMNAASQFTAIDFVVTLPDGDPRPLVPLAQLFVPGAAQYTTLHAGDYDLYLLDSLTRATLMGPTRFSVAAGGLYGVLAVDGPDTATANAIYFDDFVP